MLDLEREEGGSGFLDEVILPRLACMHGHFRDDPDITPIVVGHAAEAFDINLVEPNLTPPVTTAAAAAAYQARLRECFAAKGRSEHRLVMTLYLTPETSVEMIREAYERGIRVTKLYYKVTTNSEHGVTHWSEAETAIAAMEAICREHPNDPMFLQVHAEALGVDHHEREAACVEHMEALVAAHPDLWIAIEHVTTRAMIEFVARHPKVGASITLHHLILTWDDCVHDGRLDGHCFCAPVCKSEDDRQALLEAAFGLAPELVGKVWLGLDFAPHPLNTKDGLWLWPPQDGKLPRMGMYTLDVAAPLLVALFERYAGPDWQAALINFASANGPDWYRLPRPTGLIRLVYREWRVPAAYLNRDLEPHLRSFFADRIVRWRVAAANEL